MDDTRSAETPLDPDEVAGLIPNLRFQGELNQYEQASIREALVWARKSRKLKKELLTLPGLLLLHKRMFDGVWSWAGMCRTSEKNIGIAPYLIADQVGELCRDVTYQLKHKTYSCEETVVRFHHRLVVIHPFANGNGRHARLAADLILHFNGKPALPWGRADLVHENDFRGAYIHALRAADRGEYEELISFATSPLIRAGCLSTRS